MLRSCLLLALLAPSAAAQAAPAQAAPAPEPAAPAAESAEAVPAAEEPKPDPYAPFVAPASDEAERAIAAFKLLPGLAIELFAAEPMVANPVVLYVDALSRVYVAETFRHHHGVTDIREHMTWLEDDLASESVEERLEMFAKHEGENYADYAVEHERIRQLRDTDGDGKADVATVYADGFNDPAAGIAAGLLARGDELYYTCIPDLWLLRDADDDGVAEERRRLSSGYGINVALLGHDLHGLRIGPYGRLYFSSGDRGFSVETENGRIHHPHTGAVLRCELDGSKLEVVHTGLRNPQELVFDDWGRLFTGENNSDGGDKARWVQIVQGADSGWRYAYQWLTEPMRGPWNQEKLWYPHFAGQAAYIVPPIANLGHGPSGLAYYPGTGFGAEFSEHFLLCDFRGAPSYSGIHFFDQKEKGATFELGEVEFVLWDMLPTDCDFGPDGRLYVSDWVDGWNTKGKGRVHRMFDPEHVNSDIVRETHELLRGGMQARPIEELAGLLSHADQRVRNEAHWELAGRGLPGVQLLARVGAGTEGDFAQLHALFGLAMAARLTPEHRGVCVPAIVEAAGDPNPRIRAQAMRALGELGADAERVRAGLKDADARVRFEAGIAAGRMGDAAALPELVALIQAAGEEPYLRHAGVEGLLGCADEEQLVEFADAAPDKNVRLAAIVALRRLGSDALGRFVADSDPRIAREAARAVYDLPIEAGLPALAARIAEPELEAVVLGRRVLGANYRLGGPGNAAALMRFAAREDQDSALRVEALRFLAAWEQPSGRDRVVGAWRPLAERASPALELREELAAAAAAWTDEDVLAAFVAGVGSGPGTSAAEVATLDALWSDAARGASLRVAAFRALEAARPELRADLVDRGFAEGEGQLRAVALEALERLDAGAALERIPALLASGDYRERRAAYGVLGSLADPAADELLAAELRRLSAGLVAAELALDLQVAAAQRSTPAVRAAWGEQQALAQSDAELRPYLLTQFGGDVDAGKRVFERVELSCARCHGRGDVQQIGPDLDGVGTRLTRLGLLESIVDPNRHIARGFESTVLFLEGGDAVSGRVLQEADGVVRVVTADGERVDVESASIEERQRGLSSMPEGLAQQLSLHELRDLIEYLASL